MSVAAPGVEDHQGLRARFDLRIEVVRGRARELREQPVQRLRVAREQRLRMHEIAAAAALDHVGRNGPGRSGESDERHSPREFAANERNRIHDESQVARRIGHRQCVDVGGTAQRPLDPWPLAFREREPDAHGHRDHQDVGEEDRRVERKARERLQRDFAGEIGIRRQSQETSSPGARRAVLRQVAAGLPHDPDRRPVHRLARAARAAAGRSRARSCGRGNSAAIVAWIASAAMRGSAASRIGRPTTM